ncbi:CatA-like O-acetyltransferase [Kiloniella antarctica]|uniref:CatA-like O-acetyltransferase n=1 Tax=Kiloniella antarctica TaxID=1550907 RepID=A0ABW5BK35_9PROT
MTSAPTSKTIDLENWPRHSQYALFKDFASPHVSISARVDVTGIISAKQHHDVAPFNAMLYCIMSAINTIPELRTRFRKNNTEHLAEHLGKHHEEQSVIEHAQVHPSVTVPIENDRFAFCEIDFVSSWPEFNKNCEHAITAGKSQAKLTEKTIDTDHWIFMSCLPWLDFTEMKHPLKGPDDCVPRLAWGKFTQNTERSHQSSLSFDTNSDRDAHQATLGGIWSAPVNLTAHHALVDGIHIAQFFQKLERATQNFKDTISAPFQPAD